MLRAQLGKPRKFDVRVGSKQTTIASLRGEEYKEGDTAFAHKCWHFFIFIEHDMALAYSSLYVRTMYFCSLYVAV